MNELITIIVPVYKVEKYLPKCIDSLMQQSYKNIEIILVDDGSPDNCGVICDKYALIDKRIIVIHKSNGGLSSARNAALDIMRGEYVTFVDSDDYVSTEYIMTLYKNITKYSADISICLERYFIEYKDKCEKTIDRPFRKYNGVLVMNKEEALACSLYQDLYDAAACAKLYYSKLFRNVRFPIGYAYEDQGTIHKLFLQSKLVVYIGEYLYSYLQRNGSILHNNKNSKRYWDGICMCEAQYNDVTTQLPKLELAARTRLLNMYFHAFIGSCITEDKKLQDYAWEKIQKLRYGILNCSNARRKTKIAVFLSYFGKNVFKMICRRRK